jgi:2'-5' RNA ligase
MAAGSGGHRGTSTKSSVTSSHPHAGSSEKSLPEPADNKLKPQPEGDLTEGSPGGAAGTNLTPHAQPRRESQVCSIGKRDRVVRLEASVGDAAGQGRHGRSGAVNRGGKPYRTRRLKLAARTVGANEARRPWDLRGKIAAVATRVLAIFPEMKSAEVERFRSRWDPLAAAVPAHITIAYPFEWSGPASSLADAVRPVLAAFAPFTLELATTAIWEEEYLFLLVKRGREQIWRLHESIYSVALRGARRPFRFVPHMTIGRHAEKAVLLAGISEAAELNLPLIGRGLSLTAYRRDDDGSRVMEFDMPLGMAT